MENYLIFVLLLKFSF